MYFRDQVDGSEDRRGAFFSLSSISDQNSNLFYFYPTTFFRPITIMPVGIESQMELARHSNRQKMILGDTDLLARHFWLRLPDFQKKKIKKNFKKKISKKISKKDY